MYLIDQQSDLLGMMSSKKRITELDFIRPSIMFYKNQKVETYCKPQHTHSVFLV